MIRYEVTSGRSGFEAASAEKSKNAFRRYTAATHEKSTAWYESTVVRRDPGHRIPDRRKKYVRRTQDIETRGCLRAARGKEYPPLSGPFLLRRRGTQSRKAPHLECGAQAPSRRTRRETVSRGGQAYREPRQNDTASTVSKDRARAPTIRALANGRKSYRPRVRPHFDGPRRQSSQLPRKPIARATPARYTCSLHRP